jgi:hypothetical protein
MRSIPALVRVVLIIAAAANIASVLAALVARSRLTSSGGPADDELDLIAIFGGANLASTASALRRISGAAWYGGGTLDLRGATVDPAGASVVTRAIFGGFRLVVPETWRIEIDGKAVFGGFVDARDQVLVDPGGPLLTVKGLAIFGGVAVVSTARDRDLARVSSPPT